VFATGKTAEEMLAIAEERLLNSAEQELENAKNEQWKITNNRLMRFFRQTPSSGR
jgi:2-oxo-4-hydroxy-4-carboxy--5-ureidoimidazoline (OHCU) decarboxylase